ncbi:MAG: hypothetical protein ACRDJW_14505 [Thermomicrobiales bacterium]
MFTGATLRSLSIRLGVAGLAAAAALGGSSALAVHENVEFPAAIHAGTCEAPGEVVFALDNLVRLPEDAPEEGDPVGAAGAQVVHGSPEDSTLDATVDDLFAAPHIVAVFNADGDTIIARGPIGAYTYEEGQDLAVGLREWNESNFSGAAIFEVDDDVDDEDDDEDDDDLEVEVFLVSSTLPPGPAATPAATPVS